MKDTTNTQTKAHTMKSRKATKTGTQAKDLKVGDTFRLQVFGSDQYTVRHVSASSQQGMYWWKTLILDSSSGIEEMTMATTECIDKV